MLLLTARDLQFRASRIVTVVLGTAVVFTLLFLMTGLTEQFHREPQLTVEGLGASSWIVREGASGVFTSAATMDASAAAEIGADPIVAARHSIELAGADALDIVVIGYEGLGAPAPVAGRVPASSGEVVVDVSSELAIGDTAAIGPLTFEVVGHTRDATLFAGMPLVHMSLDAAQELVYRGQDLATAFVTAMPVTELPAGLTALDPAVVAADATRPLERSIASVDLIRVLLWLVAAMIVGAVIYLSALERRRDFAVLKAVGASSRGLVVSLAMQSIAITLVAVAIAMVLQAVVAPVFPLTVSVPSAALFQVPVIAAVVAVLASVGGIRKITRADPVAAFAGPGA
jgi:putative ABC transport system permease protein